MVGAARVSSLVTARAPDLEYTDRRGCASVQIVGAARVQLPRAPELEYIVTACAPDLEYTRAAPYSRGCASIVTARAPDLEYTRAAPSVPATTLAQPP